MAQDTIARGMANTAKQRADAAYDLAQGRTYSFSVRDISSLVSEFNNSPKTRAKIGDNIYVQSSNVPDFWVYSVESTPSNYIYRSDKAFVDDVTKNGSVQVGYYRISQLETKHLVNYAYRDSVTGNWYDDINKTHTVIPDVDAIYFDELTGDGYRYNGNTYIKLINASEEQDRIAADSALNTRINELNVALQQETTTRTENDLDLQEKINEEKTARQNADVELQNNITTEANTRAQAIIDEQNTRLENDEALGQRITTEIANEKSAREQADSNEKSQREAADNAEKLAREAADTQEATIRANADAAEKALRESADIQLASDIGDEATIRAQADGTLQENINAETTARTSADETLTEALADEETARIAADTELDTKISNENERATTAEFNLDRAINQVRELSQTVQGNLEQESNRAMSVEESLQTEIENENTRALQAESSLDAKIDGESLRAKGAESTLQNAIDVENARAQEAENNITTDLNTLKSKVPSQASEQNQLADKAFVNSSLNALAAYYIVKDTNGTPFTTKAELLNAQVYYSGGVVRVPTHNDYTIVLHDESKSSEASVGGINPTTRYIYENGVWQLQYVVNNTGLTAAQLAALNSGISVEKIAEIEQAITAEQDRALAAELAEKQRAQQAEIELTTIINNEITARENADLELSKDIDAITIPRDPEKITIGNKVHIFANGTPITVDDNGSANVITWFGANSSISGNHNQVSQPNSMTVPYGALIFGGGYGKRVNEHDKSVYFVNSQITINGGQFERVFGGCLGTGAVGVATITVNGGTITKGLHGGGQKGSDALMHSNSVGSVNITINGGTFGSVLTAGGVDAVNVGESKMTINGGSIKWLVASGSNGTIGQSKVVFNGGSVSEDALSVNRGYVQDVEWTINDGSINRLWSGADNDIDDNGSIAHCVINVFGGQVTQLKRGYTATQLMASGAVKGTYVPGYIINEEVAVEECNLVLDATYAQAIAHTTESAEMRAWAEQQISEKIDDSLYKIEFTIPASIWQRGVQGTRYLPKITFDENITLDIEKLLILRSNDQAFVDYEVKLVGQGNENGHSYILIDCDYYSKADPSFPDTDINCILYVISIATKETVETNGYVEITDEEWLNPEYVPEVEDVSAPIVHNGSTLEVG